MTPCAVCSVAGCTEAAAWKGLCEKHYRRARRTGDPGPAGPTLRQVKLDASPLVNAIEDRGGISAAVPHALRDQLPRLRRAYHRAKATGTVTAAAADLIATTCGLDVAALYGKAWWTNT